MEKESNNLSSYLENISLVLFGITFIAFPILFLTVTTDPYLIPKQTLIAVSVTASLILLGIQMIIEGNLRIRRTPFDLPIILFGAAIVVSSLLSTQRADSLTAAVPILFAIFGFFFLVNLARNHSSVFFLSSCFVLGGSLLSIYTILSYLKIYPLPLPITESQAFSLVGSLLDQGIYLALALGAAFFLAKPLFREKKATIRNLGFSLATLLILAGLLLTLYQLVFIRKPLLLPYETGFQTAMAQVSQDTGRTIQSFLFGSGFGTYSSVFTRFKSAAYNLNPTLWPLTFFRSSSFVLEILATVGVLGLAGFLFLYFRLFKLLKAAGSNPLFPSLGVALLVTLLLPFSLILQSFFFLLLALFAIWQGLDDHQRFFDVELKFLAFRKGAFTLPSQPGQDGVTRALPVILFIVFVLVFGTLVYFSSRFVLSDLTFQRSLVAASQNNGTQTYQLQNQAIRTFPYRDAYFRVYSQTNLALANALANQVPRGSSPSAQTQQTILTLIQQSINAGRTAVTISPRSSLNWQNLSSIYRSLIGFGRNAENFAILTSQQAIALDSNNPQLYLNLGGIYYQLRSFDEAQRQFQIAVRLKPDFANAYYNLGHALEEAGQLQQALVQYQTARSLLSRINSTEENRKKIGEEIDAIQKKLGGQEASPSAQTPPTTTPNQPPLGISTPSTQLPEQKPPVDIPAPVGATRSGR